MNVELTDDNTEKADERPSNKYFVHKAHSDLFVLSDNGRLHFPLNLKAVNSPDKAQRCQSMRTVRRQSMFSQLGVLTL